MGQKISFAIGLLLIAGQVAVAQSWYKGNLHTHSLWSDGDDYPEMIMEWYQANGYHFVALSDHNTLQEGEYWISVPKAPARRRVFERYLRSFGPEWVNFRRGAEDSLLVRLKTLMEYRPLFEEVGKFLILPAEEITSRFFGAPIHVNAINVREKIEPASGNSVTEVMQRNIDAVREQRRRTGQPMFPHLNHPNFGWAVTAEDLMALEGERFFEVYNGHPLVNNYGDSTRLGTEAIWDRVNLHYKEAGKPLMLGLATDDSHNYYLFGPRYSNSGRGWVMVKADALTPASLVSALEAGNFYSTTGVMLDTLIQTPAKIQLTLKPEAGVNYRIQFVGAHRGDTQTRILAEVQGTAATYYFQGDEAFVRARISSDKPKFNPYYPGEVEMAWIQPISPNRP